MAFFDDQYGAGSRGPVGGAAVGGDIIDGSDQTFVQDVLEESTRRPVIVDFWAPWCGPCRQLGPVLEAAVQAAGGKVRLVKVNTEEHPHIAQQLRVQSIPAVFAFKNGQPVDGFMGARPASDVKQFIDRLLGAGDQAKAAALTERGQKALDEGDIGGAAQDFSQALQIDGTYAPAIAGLIRCQLKAGSPEQARAMLESIPPEFAADPSIQSAKTAIEIAERGGADSAEVAALKRAVEAAPGDLSKRFELAQALTGAGQHQEAVDALIHIIEKDREWNEGAARAEILKVFEAAGPASEVARTGRKRLSSVLFS